MSWTKKNSKREKMLLMKNIIYVNFNEIKNGNYWNKNKFFEKFYFITLNEDNATQVLARKS